jgi:glycosyltransferase involved in cell wall biosynthesis
VLPQLGVDPRLFAPRSRASSDRPFTAGFVGRLANPKGIDVLIEAIGHIRRSGAACRLEICGTGPEEASLRAQADRIGAADLITWRGAVPHAEVPGVMAGLDVLVLPSRTMPDWKEQFGHVLIEAMSMGIPVLGSSSGEIPNVIGRADLIFPEGNPVALSALLQRMMSDAPWREQATAHGIQRVQEHYTDERIGERLIEGWHRILRTAGTP